MSVCGLWVVGCGFSVVSVVAIVAGLQLLPSSEASEAGYAIVNTQKRQ
jgi:hypothetical protein